MQLDGVDRVFNARDGASSSVQSVYRYYMEKIQRAFHRKALLSSNFSLILQF